MIFKATHIYGSVSVLAKIGSCITLARVLENVQERVSLRVGK
jgi:hypothetical protein